MIYQCPNCLSELNNVARFCPKCGFNLEPGPTVNLVCPECKQSYPPHTKYCSKDGTPLVSTAGILDSIYHENGYPKASLGNRFIAALLDGFIAAGFSIPAVICFIMGMNKFTASMSGMDDYEGDYAQNVDDINLDEGMISLILIGAILYLLPLTYSLIKDGFKGGQSWGKKAVGLMVINLDNNMPCNKSKSFFRNIISTIISIIPFVGWIIEPIMVLSDRSGRKLGDKAASTQVIEKLHYR